MANDEKPKDEEFEEFEEGDEEVGDDLEIEPLDEDDNFEGEGEDEEAPTRPKRGRDEYTDVSVATAVQANPKRQKARKKSRTIVGGIFQTAELTRPEGQQRAYAKLSDRTDAAAVQKPYAIDAMLLENDVVKHPKFGIGFVIEELSATKVSVLFEDGIRKLVCANATE